VDEKAHLGRNAVIVFDAKHYPAEMDRIRRCFERVDTAEEVVIPRIREFGFGEDDRFMLLNAWNYRGAPSIEPRTSSED